MTKPMTLAVFVAVAFLLSSMTATATPKQASPARQGAQTETSAKQAPAKPGAKPEASPKQVAPQGQASQKQSPPAKGGASSAPAPVVPATSVPTPPGYVIGPEDVLQVLYWREKDVSVEVTVRPDGMVSLPLLNDVKAAGLTPEQMRDSVNEAAKKFFEDPNVTIVIKTINSRKVFITGSVAKPGDYSLSAPTTVLQLIAKAGGLTEFAKQKNISVTRTENGKPVRFSFNYKDVSNGKNLKQNIELKPGDTVIVP